MFYTCHVTGAPFEGAIPLYRRGMAIVHPLIGCGISESIGLLTSCIEHVREVNSYRALLHVRAIIRVCTYSILQHKGMLHPKFTWEALDIPKKLEMIPSTSEISRTAAYADLLIQIAHIDSEIQLGFISESTPHTLWCTISQEMEKRHNLLSFAHNHAIPKYREVMSYDDFAEPATRLCHLSSSAMGVETGAVYLLYNAYLAYKFEGEENEREDSAFITVQAYLKKLNINITTFTEQLKRASSSEPLSTRHASAIFFAIRYLQSLAAPVPKEPTPTPAPAVVRRSILL